MSYQVEPYFKIACTATFTCELVEDYLFFWIKKFKLNGQIKFAPYNQIFQQLLDSQSLLRQNREGINIALIRFEDWQKKQANSTETVDTLLKRNVEEFLLAINTAIQGSVTPYLICICPASPQALLNNNLVKLYQEMEAKLVSEINSISGVYLITYSELAATYPVTDYYDPYGEENGHIPYTSNYFCALGTMLARKIRAFKSNPYKVIVLDCDNTLWSGVCGEDGALGVRIEHHFQALQKFILAQQKVGKLICLCSKNSVEDVFAVFEQNQNMILQRHHLVNWRINWQPKSENLKSLASELQLGLDSFIFIDDNPVECAEVRANCPEVLTLQIPENCDQIPRFLEHIWAFDFVKVTQEDKKRTLLYQQNIQRDRLRQDSLSFADFLVGLGLEIEIVEMQPEDIPRISQLTQRTNQFNATTIRRSETEIQQLCNGNLECRVVKVKDRFGDYGLVGLLLFSSHTEKLIVDTFLLSCRVLGRRVEYQMLACLGKIAQNKRLNQVEIIYLPTKKNQPILDFLESVGEQFKQEKEEGWLFQFKSEMAANVSFNPSQTETTFTQINHHQQTAPEKQVEVSFSGIFFENIANKLYSTELILKEISSQQKRQRPKLETTFVPPRTAQEEAIASVFGEVLKIDQVGIHDNFFELGGDSLSATQLVSRLRNTFFVEWSLKLLFEFPTIASLANSCEILQTTKLDNSIFRISRDGDLPLSFAQQRMWFLHQLDRENPFYNESLQVQITGTLNVFALEQSINNIILRHEALRTNFSTVEGKPVQKIHPGLTVTLPLIDSQGFNEAEVLRIVTKEVRQPFDLENGSLRFLLLRRRLDSHVLVLTMHHIITDGWSIQIFLKELSTLYQAFTTGEAADLPELSIQYPDFAAWQRQWLTGDILLEQLNYWKQQLAEAPPLLELPYDRPRPPVQTYRGATREFQLDKNLTKQLQTLSHKSGTTLYITLLAAYTTLLYRYTGEEDICVGSPFANRNRTEVESLIGFFVNTLVLRSKIQENLSFSEFLQQVREIVLNAHAHQDVPFEQVVEAVKPERSPSYNPLFQVMFVLENFSIDTFELPGISLTPKLVERGISQFDLSLSMWETQQGLFASWEYNSDLFEENTIVRMAGHFETLLKSIVTHPEQSISELPLLTQKEQHQLLVEWNNTYAKYPNKTIHQLFEEQVQLTPKNIALEYGSEKLTYEELNLRANQLAHYLQSLDVAPDMLVGLCVERSPLMVIGLLAILKAGGAYVPLDPNYPQERLAYMLSDSQVSVLLTKQKCLESLPQIGAKVVCFDTDWPVISTHSDTNPVATVQVNNLAYVIYTSGSTGKPKGVMIEHQSLVNFTQAAKIEYGISSQDRVLQFAPISFDVAVEEIYPCLTSGGTLVLRTDEILNSVSLFVEKCRSWELTVLDLPTAYWQQLISELATTGEILPPSVRLVIIGGEAVLPEKIRLWQKYVEGMGKSLQLINAYGPTETTVEATIFKLSGFVLDDTSQIPIGRPIGNVQTYILDKYLQPVPIGVPGELYIGGAGLARGYLNRPELTEEKFIPNPFGNSSGCEAKLYKTGDKARYLPDGNIEFLRRIDNQVKIRGFRIELGEIETALTSHPHIKEAVVIVREDEPGKKRLVAYVVETLHVTSLQIQNTLRDFLKQKLPDYMAPATFVILNTLPLTPSGKVDRRALPAPSVSNDPESFVAPRTPEEEILAAIWKDVLRLRQVGIHDNFFELGGDSIISIQIIARANQAGLKLTAKQLFGYQTIAELASVAGITTINLQAEQGLVTGEVPLTPIQHWFFEQNFVEPHHFNQAMMLSVPPDIKPELLQQVLQQLLIHHDALRLQYIQHNSVWQQINRDVSSSVPFQIVDFSNLTSEEQKTAIARKANEQQRALNIFAGNLMQVILFKLGSSSPGRLLIVIHHLAIDGVSWRILLEDLTTAYQQLDAGKPIQLPAKTTSFKDWAYRLRDGAQGQKLDSLTYWLQITDKFATLLPVDYTYGESINIVASSDIVSVYLSTEKTRNLLQDIPSVYNTQINDVLLAALVQTFSQWTGCDSLLVDLEGHGREELFEDVDLSRTVGWFTSVFPVLLKLEDSIHPGEALKSVKEQLRRIPERGIGYGILRYLSLDKNICSQLQALPQAQISFNYLGQFDQTDLSNGWKLTQEFSGDIHSPLGQRSHLIEIDGLVIDGKLQMDWRYSKNIHRQSTVEGLASDYLQALEAIIAHCLSKNVGGYTPSDFPEAGLSQDELDNLLSSIL